MTSATNKCAYWLCQNLLPLDRKKFCCKKCSSDYYQRTTDPEPEINEDGEILFDSDTYDKRLFAI